jgi:hypothetical protein
LLNGGISTISGGREFAIKEAEMLKRLFPEGLKFKLETVLSDDPHVLVLAEADLIAMNGKRYRQRRRSTCDSKVIASPKNGSISTPIWYAKCS